jgi:hypothetical protein
VVGGCACSNFPMVYRHQLSSLSNIFLSFMIFDPQSSVLSSQFPTLE